MESIGASRKKMKMPCLPNDSCSEPLESEDAKDVFQGQAQVENLGKIWTRSW